MKVRKSDIRPAIQRKNKNKKGRCIMLCVTDWGSFNVERERGDAQFE